MQDIDIANVIESLNTAEFLVSFFIPTQKASKY